MAAGTVTLLSPPDAGTGLPIGNDAKWVFSCGPYSGTDTVTEIQIQIALTADTGFASPVYDSGLRAVDARKFGVGIWAEVFPALIGNGALASTVYRWRVRTRNGLSETSAYPTAFTFTTSAADVSAAEWAATQ